MQLPGAWLLELGELDAFQGKESSSIKAFLSRQIDKFRPPFERMIMEVPRQNVFAASTNEDEPFKDHTEARRFWPVEVRLYDGDALARDRDQIWAEALHRFLQGESWWMDTPDLVDLAAGEQARMFADDPWSERIAIFIEGRDQVSLDELGINCLGLEVRGFGQGEKNRIARILQREGWERKQVWIDRKGRWRYCRASAL